MYVLPGMYHEKLNLNRNEIHLSDDEDFKINYQKGYFPFFPSPPSHTSHLSPSFFNHISPPLF